MGNWELKEIYLLETNKQYPLDSFRNVISANIKFNSDSSFLRTDNFGSIKILPLSSGLYSLQESYDKPRHPKARFIIASGHETRPITSSKFGIQDDKIYFETNYVDVNTSITDKSLNQYELKSNSELDIYQENLMLYNQQSNSFLSNYKMKFVYKRKSF